MALKGTVANEAEEESRGQKQDDHGVRRNTYEGIQSDHQFKWCQHNNDYGLHRTLRCKDFIHSNQRSIEVLVIDYSITLTSLPGMFTSLEEIQT